MKFLEETTSDSELLTSLAGLAIDYKRINYWHKVS